MSVSWRDYQEEVASFFRSLGLDAQTNVRIEGVRTHHEVDVLVRFHHVGFELTWVIECKHWHARVSKLHLLALRQIVAETGADRGVLLSEDGFQSGVLEAAALTNVRATSLAALRDSAKAEILAMRLREFNDRAIACEQRYWNIPKDERIRRGLRPDTFAFGYSGTTVIACTQELLARALRGLYPFECKSWAAYAMFDGPRSFASSEDVVGVLEPMLTELERLLAH